LVDDILFEISKLIDIYTLNCLLTTNKRFNSIRTKKEIWQYQYNNLFVNFEIHDPEYIDKCITYYKLYELLGFQWNRNLKSLYQNDYLFICYENIKIPKSIVILQQLKSIYLDGNKFINIPETLFSLKKLENLSFIHNRIRKIPKTICNLSTSLRTLQLQCNRIKKLPQWLSKLENLESLNLGTNRIEKIPFELSNLNKLHSLYLFENKIIEVPKCLFEIKTLKVLDLSKNSIITIPNNLISLNPNLQIKK
jgi:Leucine-rich repeat (LRR) protein